MTCEPNRVETKEKTRKCKETKELPKCQISLKLTIVKVLQARTRVMKSLIIYFMLRNGEVFTTVSDLERKKTMVKRKAKRSFTTIVTNPVTKELSA